MTVSFLFWNIQKKPLRQSVGRIAKKRNVDVVMLAECGDDPIDILASLRDATGQDFEVPFSMGTKTLIFTRFPGSRLLDAFNSVDESRLTIRRLTFPDRPEIILAVCHYQSQNNWNEVDQALHATELSSDISKVEVDRGHSRTILVGDLNMNPFDPGVVGAQCLNAVMTRGLAEALSRTVAGRSYRYFYNPMWGLLGDRTPGPCGSFFYPAATPTNRFWNTFDQVLLRPSLMDNLSAVEILASDGVESLVTRLGRPRKNRASDTYHFSSQLRFKDTMMAREIPILWPQGLNPDVLTPLAIMRVQESALAKLTRGVLTSEVTVNTAKDEVSIGLDLVAPALGNYRQRILNVKHKKGQVYPVELEAACFSGFRRPAMTDEEFIAALQEVLSSGTVQSQMLSMMARSNDESDPQRVQLQRS